MKRSLLLAGIAIGGALMYVLDPQLGHRRRTLARDKMAKAVHQTGRAMGATSRDVAHRATGLAASLHSSFFDREAPDEVIAARVRARLGRVSSHPAAIDVTVRNGVATLGGPVLRQEVSQIVRSVSSVRGVTEVVNQLESHDAAEHVPGLQGGTSGDAQTTQAAWPPATRILMAASGAILATFGIARRDRAGVLLAGIGVGLLTRAASDAGIERLADVIVNRGRPHEAKGIPIPVRLGPAPGSSGPRPIGTTSDRIH